MDTLDLRGTRREEGTKVEKGGPCTQGDRGPTGRNPRTTRDFQFEIRHTPYIWHVLGVQQVILGYRKLVETS